jgi:hypothetical protein
VLSKIRDLFRPAPPPEPIRDDALGLIHFNSEEKIWEVRIVSAPHWRICIAGGTAPDPALILHARDVAASHDHFSELVSAFLRSEAATSFPGAEKEILSLRLESMCLFWPSRPNDGMLFFEGGEEGRLWRCDYIDRKPNGLGFDS